MSAQCSSGMPASFENNRSYPQFVDPSVGLLVGDDRDRKIDSSALSVEVENHLLKAASLGDDVLHVLDRMVALAEPRVRFGDECLERPPALDTSAYGVVQLGLAGDKRAEILLRSRSGSQDDAYTEARVMARA